MLNRHRLLSLLFLTACPAFSQGIHPITGRQIAGVMGMGGATWLVRPEREMEEEPDKALDAIGLRKGDQVADIGAGVGYFTWRMAERVGQGGKVYGVDIQEGMLKQLRQNIEARGLRNVEAVLGAVDDPNLAPGCCDLILMVDVYHEFSEPQKMLRKMREALKPSGRMVLLEYRKEDPTVPIRIEHKMTVKEVRAELEPEALYFQKSLETLPRQHILIFTKKPALVQ